MQAVFAGTCERVYARAKVNRLGGHQDAHVGSDRNHAPLQNELHTRPRLASPWPLSCTRIFAPCAFSSSSTHSCVAAGASSRLDAARSGIDATGVDMMISKNSVSCPSLAAPPSLPCSKRRFKPASATPSTPATRSGGCSWHIRTAWSHSSPGMRLPRTRDSRQSLKCLTTSFRHTAPPSPIPAISVTLISCTPFR